MKKELLILASLLTWTAASALQLGPTRLHPVADGRFNSIAVDTEVAALPAKAPMKTDGTAQSMNFTKAGEPYSAIGFNNAKAGSRYAMAFEMTTADVNKFLGNSLTSINFYTGTNVNTRKNNILSATVFLTYDLEEEPFYTQETEAPETEFTPVSVPLETPYEFEEGKKIYVGVRVAVTKSTDYPIVIDYMGHADYTGGWVAYYDETAGEYTWDNVAADYGFVCLGATISGSNLPQNEVEATDMAVDFSAYNNQAFTAQVLITNKAANPVSELTLSYSIGSLEAKSKTVTFPKAIEYGKSGVITIPDLSHPTASPDPIPVTFTITNVGTADNLCENNTIASAIQIVPEGKGYTPNVVIEEFTGTWCGYCPVGIVTMESIREDYPDGELIPVAVHVNSGGTNREPMYAASYKDVSANFSAGGVPGSTMNRKVSVYPWPYEDVIATFEAFRAMPSFAEIKATAKMSETEERVVEITTTTTFAYDYTDASGRYAISFGVTEDGVGPHNQNNYYANTNEDAGGWESKGSSVSTIYNDVARQLSSFRGLAGSIPDVIESGKEYTFNHSLTLISSIKDISKINIIAYLIDKNTFEIVNAATVKSSNIEAGIDQVTVDADANAPVEYFNLQGITVKNPADGGIYIRRQGNTVKKVVL